MKVKLKSTENIKVHLKPKQSIKLRNKNVYVYDPNIIGEYVSLAEDWAKKTDGFVDETDYSSKAYAIGGEGTETNNSKYYAEQASDSASAAATSETNASASELSAHGYAANAYTSETNAQGYAQTAVDKADEAAISASTATAQAVIAKGHADNAADSATTATTQAGIATTQAGNASASASAAATSAASAANSAIWAEGTDEQVREIGGTHSAKGWVNTLGTIYKPAGSVAFENLPALSSDREGYVYNVDNAFTTTSDFVEGAGKSYPAGTNVVCIDVGSSVYKWDVLSGFVDLSSYRTAAAQDAIDATKASASDVSAIQANYVTTNTAQTISGQKTFSSTPRRSSTIDLTATTGQTEVVTLTTLDKGNQVFSSFNSCRSSTTNYVQQRITNKNLESTSNWFDIRANITDAGNGYANVACGSGVTNYNLTNATSSTSSAYLATMGWVNNASTATNVVHRSGAETITGTKNFSSTTQPQVIRKNANQTLSTATSEVVCTCSFRDSTDVAIGVVGSFVSSSGSGMYMQTASWANSKGIRIKGNYSDKTTNFIINTTTTQVTTPTEDTTSSTQIDTVGARNTKLQGYATTAYVDGLVGAVHIVETGHNGTEWYRVWSDGFCEQGGTVGTGTTSGYPSYTIQLTKEYADTNFNVQVTGRYKSNTNDGTNYCSARTTDSITIRSVGYGSDWVTRGYIS